jgi:hypothetical protein
MDTSPTTNRLAELSTHGSVIVRAPETVIVRAAPGEPWFADDEAPEEKLQHPAVTRWLESLIVAPTIEMDDLDIGDRVKLLLTALDARALAAEWGYLQSAA